MPTRSQRPLLNKLLGLEPLWVGQVQFTTIDDALMVMGTDFTPERLAAALDDQADVEVTVTTLYRWKREASAQG